MAQLREDIGRKKLAEKDIFIEIPYFPRGGILSAHLVCVVNTLHCHG